MSKPYKIAMTVGCFDLLHDGHLNLLNKMKEMADNVVVLLHSNRSIFENKGKFPVQNYDDRQSNLMDSSLVNSVIAVLSADPTYQINNFLDRNNPSEIIYMRGDDWNDFPGQEAVKKSGVKIKYINYTEGISSTILSQEIKHKNI